MPNNNYRNGAAYERRIATKLKQKGYYVMRSSGSHGIFDLIAIDFNSGHIMFIQLKNYAIGKKEFQRISEEIKALAPQPAAEVSFYILEHAGKGTDRMTLIK